MKRILIVEEDSLLNRTLAFNILGNVYSISWLGDVAGTVTAVSSFLISGFLLIVSQNYKKQ